MRGGLIELELRDGLGSREVEGRGLIEVELGLGRTPGGRHPGRPVRQVEMEKDALDGGGYGDEGDDLHVAAAGGTQERKHLVDASQDSVVAMAMDARRRNEPGQAVEELVGRETKLLATVHIGLGGR